jgi:tetratricopeptide (TPR) repeat protein
MLWLALLLFGADYADLFNRGLAAYQAKRDAEAEPLLAEAARLRPGEFQAQFLLGAARSRLGRSDDALVAWRKAEALQPKNARLLQVMAVEYSRGRYFQDAARTAAVALRLNPDDSNLYFIAIKSYQDAGDTAAAAAVARDAVARFPQSGRAHFEHGFHLQKQGLIEESLGHLRKAMELELRYEEPPFFFGDLLVRRENPALLEAVQGRAFVK